MNTNTEENTAKIIFSKIFRKLSHPDISLLNRKGVHAIIKNRLDNTQDPSINVPTIQLIQIIAIAIAILIAFFAQVLLQTRFTKSIFSSLIRPIFTSNFAIEEQTLAIILFFTSAILFTTCVPSWKHLHLYQCSTKTVLPRLENKSYLSKPVVFSLAVICYVVSILTFTISGESSWVQILWLAAIGLLIFSQCTVSFLPASSITLSQITPFIIVFAITGLAFFLRAYQLDTIPEFFHGDVASIGLQSRDILIGKEKQLFKLGWFVHPMMAFLPTTITQSVFGDTLFGIRAAPLFMGTLSVAGIYFLIWRSFDNHFLAAIVSLILAVTASHIIYSHAPTLLDPWAFAIWGWFFLIDGLKRHQNISFVIAGVFSGMTLQLYHSGRLNGFILASFIIYLLLLHRKKVTGNFMGLGLFIISIFFIIGPNLIYFLNVGLVTRGDAFVFSNPAMLAHLQNKYNTTTAQGVLFEQIRRTFLMFHIMGDGSSQIGTYAYPMFTDLFSPFIWCGVAISTRNYKYKGFVLILITFIGALTSSILTSDPPYWPRLTILMPICTFFIGLTLYTTYQTVINYLNGNKLLANTKKGAAHPLHYLIFCIIFLFVGGAGFSDWLEYRKISLHDANIPVQMARFTTTLPQNIDICSFSNWNATEQREVIFMAYPCRLKVIPANSPINRTEDCSKEGSVWLLNPNQNAQLSALHEAFPQGQAVTHLTNNGVPAFISFSP